MKDQCPECGGLGTITIAVDTGTFGTGYFREEVCDCCDGEGEVECDFCAGPLTETHGDPMLRRDAA